MSKAFGFASVLIIVIFLITGCMTLSEPSTPVAPTAIATVVDGNEVMGFGILERLMGQWNGPVMTATPAGSFPEWYVDFRPVLPGQVAQYSTLDNQTINYMSFFIVRRDGEMKVALRTEGVFQNQGCVTYELIDRVDEDAGYYRFSDFKAKDERAFTEFYITEDRLIMEVYTNRFNRVSPLELHSRWEATLGSRDAAVTNARALGFPRPVVVKDFSNTFENMSESIYYEFDNDPYPSEPQPFVGTVTVEIDVDPSLTFHDDHELLLLLTTDSLFDGYTYDPDNLRYISRSVYLPVGTESYTFTNIHPGTYFLYSYNDVDGDKYHKSGDYMSSNLENTFVLEAEGHLSVDTKIDIVIP